MNPLHEAEAEVARIERLAERRRAVANGEPNPAAKPLRSGSYLTAVTVIRNNTADVLEGRALRFNEMLGCPMLGAEPLRDVDVSRVRAETERRIPAGEDKQG